MAEKTTDIWIATTNQGKMREIQSILQEAGWNVRSIKEIPAYTPPPETGTTLVENARIKAKSLKAMKPGEWVMADDSGLEVAGLGGLPGVHSARYAGPHAKDAENYLKILKMLHLKAVSDKSAHFKSCLVIYDPSGKETVVEGVLKGTISKSATGTDGFGYDPIFIPQGETQTLAELGIAYKNRVSHRAQALMKWLELKPNAQ